MKLIDKLLNYVNSAFDKEPDSFVALRVRHTSDDFSWQVSERTLTLSNASLVIAVIDLSLHTIRSLSNCLATLPGITVTYATTDSAAISACSLLDGLGYQDQSNGDIILAYQSTLWMYLDALATELREAKLRIVAMLDQMSIKTADNDWLDEWGGYFDIPRLIGETDAIYSNRIIAEVIKPRGNNKAIEAAILQKYGQASTINDLVKWGEPNPGYNGGHLNDGSVFHDSAASPLYGLFEIVVGYDLLSSGDQPEFIKDVHDFIDKLRDSGTHLESVNLDSSQISDVFAFAPVDSGLSLTITHQELYGGAIYHNGASLYAPIISAESL